MSWFWPTDLILPAFHTNFSSRSRLNRRWSALLAKIQVFQSKCEITCEAVKSSDIIKANKTLKKLKKAEQSTEKDTDGESV